MESGNYYVLRIDEARGKGRTAVASYWREAPYEYLFVTGCEQSIGRQDATDGGNAQGQWFDTDGTLCTVTVIRQVNIDLDEVAPYEPTGKLKPIPANCLRY